MPKKSISFDNVVSTLQEEPYSESHGYEDFVTEQVNMFKTYTVAQQLHAFRISLNYRCTAQNENDKLKDAVILLQNLLEEKNNSVLSEESKKAVEKACSNSYKVKRSSRLTEEHKKLDKILKLTKGEFLNRLQYVK